MPATMTAPLVQAVRGILGTLGKLQQWFTGLALILTRQQASGSALLPASPACRAQQDASSALPFTKPALGQYCPQDAQVASPAPR